MSAEDKKQFPKGLLKQPLEESTQYFGKKVFDHRYFTEAVDKAMDAILNPAGCFVVGIYGPSGTGKTTLFNEIQKEMLKIYSAELEQDPGMLACAYLEVPPSDSGRFLWSDFYTEYLDALSDCVIDGKIDLPVKVRGITQNEDGTLAIDRNLQVQKLRRAVESAVRHRRPKVVQVDEAQQLARMSNGSAETLRDNMDVLKHLANKTQTVHLLAGNYDLTRLLVTSDQVCRRTEDIHIPPYRSYNKEDVAIFQDILFTFEAYLPVAEELDLLIDWEYIYEGCAGCIGTLKQWFDKALYIALKDAKTVRDGTRRLRKPFRYYLEKRRHPDDKLATIMDAILDEDERQTRTGEKISDTRIRFNAAPRKAKPADDSTSEGDYEASSPKKKNRKAFERSPKSDPVGVAALSA